MRLLLLLTLASSLLAQSSRPEHTLAGIHLNQDTKSDMYRRLGHPNHIEDQPDLDGPVARGDRSYYWYRGANTIRVDTHYASRDKVSPAHEGPAQTIDIFGDRAAQSYARTGAGLHIGDKLSTARKLYRQVALDRTSEDSPSRLVFHWIDGTRLTIDADSSGHIIHLQLTQNEDAD